MTGVDVPGLRTARPALVITRGLRWLASPLMPFCTVLFPDRRVGPEVSAGSYGWPLFSVVVCACVAASPSFVPDGHPVLERLLASVDIFTLWSVVILAFGLCAAADLQRTKSVLAIATSVVLYLAVTRLIMGGAEPAPGVGGR